LKGNYNIMFTTQNTTSRTLQGSCHMKYTNLCNEEKRAKPSTPRYLTKRPNPLGSPGTKCHLDVGLVERHRGEGDGFPQV
jgi:hypothetical protein